MSLQCRNFLDANRHHYDLLIRAQYVKQLDYATREGLLRAAQEFSPGYNANLWCGDCVADMLRRVYEWYDQWKIKNPDVETQGLVN